MKVMRTVISFYRKHSKLIRNLLALTLLSLITSHLTDNELFSPNSYYDFPWESTLISIGLGIIIGWIAKLNFQYYSKHHFSKSISLATIIRYILSTLGIISIVYLFVYTILVWLTHNDFEFYYFLIGLLITLLLCAIAIVLIYGEEIYKMHRSNFSDLKLTIRRNGKTTKVSYNEIAYFYSEDKIVYLVKLNGESLATEFTLQELESKLTQNVFFRANRQFIVHLSSVDQISTIENGKLEVKLNPQYSSKNNSQVVISRYKKQEFLTWFDPDTNS